MARILGIIGVLAFVAAACGDTSPDSGSNGRTTVASDDGSFSVVVDDSVASDLTVTEFHRSEGLRAYKVSPSQPLDNPATAEFRIPTTEISDVAVPIVLVANDDGTEIEAVPASIDTTDEEIIVTASTDHFTLIVLSMQELPAQRAVIGVARPWKEGPRRTARPADIVTPMPLPLDVPHLAWALSFTDVNDALESGSSIETLAPLITSVVEVGNATASPELELIDPRVPMPLLEEGAREGLRPIGAVSAPFVCRVETQRAVVNFLPVVQLNRAVVWDRLLTHLATMFPGQPPRPDGPNPLPDPLQSEISVLVPVRCSGETGTTTTTSSTTTSSTLPPPTTSGDLVLDTILELAGIEPGDLTDRSIIDALQDWLDSDSTNNVSLARGVADIESTVDAAVEMRQEIVNAVFNNSTIECGDDDPIVLCAPAVPDMPAGEVLVVGMRLAEPVPLRDPDHSLIYSVVFDSDGNPANDWVFRPPFDWDYFQGADRWVQAIWDHQGQRWNLVVNQVDNNQRILDAQSATRAVIAGNYVVFFVPRSEVGEGAYRLTAFAHDGRFSVDERGGDVSGADPTEPLRVPTGEPIVATLPVES